MKKSICMLTCFAVILAIQAQKADSLIHVLNTSVLTAAGQIRLYKEICNHIGDDTEQLILYAEKGLALAQKEKNKIMEAEFYQYLGLAADEKADFQKAFACFGKMLDLAAETNAGELQAAAYISFGVSYCKQNNYTLGVEYFLKALAIHERLGDKKMYSTVLNNIAAVYRTLNNNKRAVYYLEKGRAIVEEMNDPAGKCGIYYNLGAICYEEGRYEEAVEYELKVVEICRSLGSRGYEFAAMQALAQIYSEGLKVYDKAEEYARACLQLAGEFDSPDKWVVAWKTLANIYRVQERYEACDRAASKAWEIDSLSIDSGLDLTFDIALSNIFLGNKEKAAAFFRKYYEMSKQLNDKSLHDSLTEMEVRYETEKKEMRITLLEKERALYTGLSSALLLIILLAFGLLFFRHRLNVQKRRLAEQQVEKLEQEKQLIAARAVLDGENAERSRLARDLHDGLGGMLFLIKLNLKEIKSYSMMEASDVEHLGRALGILNESIGELRRIAHHIMPESLVREGLKSSVGDFCRAVPGAHFRYAGSDARLDSSLEILLYRCTYELVNNALKHAGASNIDIQLIVDKELIALTVCDDGIGFDPCKTRVSGSGLDNIYTRVTAARGKLNICSSPGQGTEVSIEIEGGQP
ncbi:MAG: tetratricopeptide repeat protein [Tannerellaceae bacterium]|jgi:signal transduction histidine kinase|nr:tetratricopeptide repeat protein [Tannerellaceae bacterium]